MEWQEKVMKRPHTFSSRSSHHPQRRFRSWQRCCWNNSNFCKELKRFTWWQHKTFEKEFPLQCRQPWSLQGMNEWEMQLTYSTVPFLDSKFQHDGTTITPSVVIFNQYHQESQWLPHRWWGEKIRDKRSSSPSSIHPVPSASQQDHILTANDWEVSQRCFHSSMRRALLSSTGATPESRAPNATHVAACLYWSQVHTMPTTVIITAQETTRPTRPELKLKSLAWGLGHCPPEGFFSAYRNWLHQEEKLIRCPGAATSCFAGNFSSKN